MIDRVIRFSIERRWLVLLLTAIVAAVGAFSYARLPIDAVPDITNVQVQINTPAPGLSPQEVEQRITFVVETSLAGIPHLEYTRSQSRYGLSQVTAVFTDGTDIYFARQRIAERIQEAQGELPPQIQPGMGPIATGLGEIFVYTVHADANARQPDGSPYDSMALRTIQDWIIRPQLRQVAGVAEVNSIGGFERQYHVTPAPAKLLAFGLSFKDVIEALERNNANAGAGYIEKNGEQFLIRAPGQVGSIDDIARIVVVQREGLPVTVRDVADVVIGRELRTGAATRDGEETVQGTAIMLIGENSRTVSRRVAAKLEEINHSLPQGVHAVVGYDRTALVDRTIATVQTNLAAGALLVALVLLTLLGNWRAATITVLVIPLSMLFLIIGMVESGVSANLMSLGALDFGLIVDGAVIIVENCVLRLSERRQQSGAELTPAERHNVIAAATREVFTPSLVTVLVIVLVNLPILALSGVEGKMFRPMAFTVITALIGALAFSLTFVPAAVALLVRRISGEHEGWLMRRARGMYDPALRFCLAHGRVTLAAALVSVILAAALATRLGTEFVPNLDEGDVAVEVIRIPGTGMEQSLALQVALERAWLTRPEVRTVFGRLGTAEVATDPGSPGRGDYYIMLKPRSEWPDSKRSKADVLRDLQGVSAQVPGTAYEFSQPIQLRFNELISGVRSDVAIKIFGDDLPTLVALGNRVAATTSGVSGARDVKREEVDGLPMLTIEPQREALARYGLKVTDVQQLISIALGGAEAGQMFEGDKRFDIVVRLPEALRSDLRAIERLPVPLPEGGYVPLAEVARLATTIGPNEMSRENGKRRIVVTANVRGRDLGGFVNELQGAVAGNTQPPPGYWIDYGGTFEQLQSATRRLRVLVPGTLFLIFALLLMTFGSAKNATLVFSGVPLALTGGVLALWLRGIPLSISAVVGFITLFGVAVLTGVVMISAFRPLAERAGVADEAIAEAAMLRLRPILMIALVASLGFLPMALNTGTGAEVQRPLATVVIGGILSATLLSLLVLPVLYRLTYRPRPAAG